MPNITGIEDGKCTTDLDLNFKQLLNFSASQVFPNSGYSGYSGFSGYSGYSGYSSKSGYSGFSGVVAQDPVVRHIVATVGNTPTVVAGSAAGATPTISIFGGSTDTAGVVGLTTGNAPSGTSGDILCTVTFGNAFANAPIVIIQPVVPFAIELGTTFVQTTATTFVVKITTALSQFIPLDFSWIAIGK